LMFSRWCVDLCSIQSYPATLPASLYTSTFHEIAVSPSLQFSSWKERYAVNQCFRILRARFVYGPGLPPSNQGNSGMGYISRNLYIGHRRSHRGVTCHVMPCRSERLHVASVDLGQLHSGVIRTEDCGGTYSVETRPPVGLLFTAFPAHFCRHYLFPNRFNR
jgi:hypothetical protein